MSWPKINSSVKLFLLLLGTSFLLLGFAMAQTESHEGNPKYYKLSPAELIISKGPAGSFDHSMVHTLSILELNKNGYRFWGYYTAKSNAKSHYDMGLAYSNDLINWEKCSTPVVGNLRWGTVVVTDGIINMFGTRNYGGDTYIVRLTSEDGVNFSEQETVVQAAVNEKNQNPFIYYDEKNSMYRLYYFHQLGAENRLEEKHATDITQLAASPAKLVLADSHNILAAPSVFRRDDKYWLTAETCPYVNGVPKWSTVAYVSDDPVTGFMPLDNYNLLVNDEACFFPYIFDNTLIGVYSQKYADGTWELLRRTHDFAEKYQIRLSPSFVELSVDRSQQLVAKLDQSNWFDLNITDHATWATSDNSVVTVQKGKITAKKEGFAVITVSYGGASTTTLVKVVETDI